MHRDTLIFQNTSAGFGTLIQRLVSGQCACGALTSIASRIRLPRLHRAGPSASLDEYCYGITSNYTGACGLCQAAAIPSA